MKKSYLYIIIVLLVFFNIYSGYKHISLGKKLSKVNEFSKEIITRNTNFIDNLKNLTKGYIPASFSIQKNNYILNGNKGKVKSVEDEDILSHLYKDFIEQPENDDYKYFFILSSSGIGKTTLLLKLYLDIRKKYYGNKKIYFLPFSERNLVYNFHKQVKENGILFLDAIDEDFELGKKEEIKIDDLRINTEDFYRVIITSREEFFRKRVAIEDFTKRTSSLEHSDHKVIKLNAFTNEQIIEFINKKFKGNFLTPFIMEHTIKVNRRLISQFHQYDIGKGAKFDLRELRHNSIMVKYLCEEHTIDPYCIVGNIGKLFQICREILNQECIREMTYKEYLQSKMRGEFNALPKKDE